MITVRAKGVKKFILTLYSLINLHNASIVKTCIQASSQLEEKRWREEKRREEKRREEMGDFISMSPEVPS